MIASQPRRGASPRAALLLAVAALAAFPTAAQRRDFAPEGTEPLYMPERGYDLLHRRLDLSFDHGEGSVAGTTANRLTPLRPGTRWITLHAAELDITSVRVGGAEAAWEDQPGERRIRVDLGREVDPGEEVEVVVEYSARPRMGLYFVGPDEGYPDKPRQIWSQGESEFNRYWFPGWDHPNDRATTEAVYTVEEPFRVVSNGRLVGVEERPGGRRAYHWVMDRPHVNYLVSVVAGELVEIEDRWGDVPVTYHVPPGREEEARRSFGKTPRMMEFFSTATDEPYPWPRYAQTTAVDFIWGGMENISATTQTLATLHDARAASDVSSDGLVAHELAHQWFGDLVTCRTWAHAWLNEGFATYFTGLWREHADGADELAWAVDEWRGDYFQEDAEEYRRPIVTHRYPFPMALFDAHLYPKGALVLHMVRDLTGDLGWWRGIAAYLDRHREATVVTADFQAAMEEATGVSLGPLFDQYVYGAGHPELAVRWGWIGDRRLVRVDVEQTQERTEETGLFSYPALELGLLGADGSLEIAAVPLEARERQSLYLPAAERPRTLVFDPRGVFLAEADFAKPTAEWAHQLTLTAYLPARLAAIRALARKGDAEAVAALGRVAAGDPFWGARAEAAEALGQVASREARAALEPALDDAESRVRREALEALGAFAAAGSTRPLLARLQRALQEDPSYYARAAAARALGRFARDRRQAAALLLAALEQDSHHQVVRAAALESLARLDEPRAWPEARRLAAYGAPAESRPAAMKALATLARGDAGRTGEALDLLLPWARGDRSAEAREGAYEALAALGDAAGLAVLDEVAAADIDPQQRRAAAAAAHELRRELAADGGLRRRVEELEGETRRLRGELAEVKGHR